MRNVEEVKHRQTSLITQANAGCENPANAAENPAEADTASRENGSANGGPTLPHDNKRDSMCGARTKKGPCSKPPAKPTGQRCAQHGGKSTGATLQGRLKISKLYRQRDDQERIEAGDVVCSPELVAELRRRHIYPVKVFVGCSRSQVVRAREARPVLKYNAIAFSRAVRHVPPCPGCDEHRGNRE
jgi:hypothetical protein